MPNHEDTEGSISTMRQTVGGIEKRPSPLLLNGGDRTRLDLRVRFVLWFLYSGRLSDVGSLVLSRYVTFLVLQLLQNPHRCILAQSSARNDSHVAILPSPLP